MILKEIGPHSVSFAGVSSAPAAGVVAAARGLSMNVVDYSAEALAAAAPCDVADRLEGGQIVRFPVCPLPLPDEADQRFLRDELPARLRLKNISYHPEADRVRGIEAAADVVARVHRILVDHSRAVDGFLTATIPSLTRHWRLGTCSFRPIEERGRNLKPHASNELVHIDAGAYGATNGDRILRFFVNLNPERDRIWATKGAFPTLYEKYGEQAGIRPANGGAPSLRKGPLDYARTGLVRLLTACGLKMAHVLDSSPYDRVMRQFHNFMKDTPAFQADREHHEEIRFAPFSAWMVLTDTVSHASLSGQFALVTTGIVPLANCRHPELAPINLLRAA
jgi:hypothetical protein